MKFQEPDRVQKIILLIINSVVWLSFSIRMIKHWHVIPWGPRLFEIYLAIMFPLLWHELIREKSRFSLLMGFTLVFGGVVGLALQAF
jgi:hypothetical protein